MHRQLAVIFVALCVAVMVTDAFPGSSVVEVLTRVLRQAVGAEEECCTVCEEGCGCCYAVHPQADYQNEGVVLPDAPLDNAA